MKLFANIFCKEKNVAKITDLVLRNINADGDASDPEYRRRIIDRLINSIFIYDDKILVFFNILNNQKITFDMLPDLEGAEAITAINNKNPESVNGDNNGVLF